MGELTINPKFNIHKTYKKVIYVNPFNLQPPTPAIVPFVSTWDTRNVGGGSLSNQISIPFNEGVTNCVVNWGDGTQSTITSYNQAERLHTYATSGVYTITITGIMKGLWFNYNSERLKIISISSWGCIGMTACGVAFYGCSNLNLSTVSDVLDLTNAGNSIYAMFAGCTSLTSVNRITEWNTESIINVSALFLSCSNFNQNLTSLNTNAVTNMNRMFSGCSKLNLPVNFNTSNVTDMSSMFSGCSLFNQPVSNLNTAKVTDMNNLFAGCAKFNQTVSNFNTTLVTNMNSMFLGCSLFNQPVSNFNTANVTNFAYMFESASIFNQPVSNFNTANATTLERMFTYNAIFNQDVSGWNTAKVTNMYAMFYGNNAFNQNIGAWNISLVTNLGNFLNAITAAKLSTTNLDAIYNGWSSRPVKPGINITFGTAKYTSASSAGRAILTGAPNNWVIVDGGI